MQIFIVPVKLEDILLGELQAIDLEEARLFLKFVAPGIFYAGLLNR